MRKRAILAVAATVFLSVMASVPTQGQQAARQPQLPEGPGRDLVQATCSKCHSTNFIVNSFGFTHDEWLQLFSSMVALPKNDADTISNYLAKNFPEKPDTPKGVIIPGPASVTFKEWLVPTLGSRPHDPLAARDGSIWWSGQYASRVGRLDPKTGAMKEFPMDTPNSGPHGLVEDKDGNIWYMGINVAEIGKLDPRTGAVTEFKVPEPGRSPHTPIFDQKGMLFFTMQNGYVGRLNPATGEIKVAKTPSDNTYPYGIQVNSKGVPWYVDFRGNRLGSVDPVTMAIKEYTLPDPAARPRRIALTRDDIVWYADFARGYLGRYDPQTGQTKEWLSPSGKESAPYGIAAIGDVIWYSESGVKPNTLVRFDTKSEKFQTWAVPYGGHVIRNMMATPQGNLVLALSGVNRVALAEVGRSRNASN